MSRGTQSSLRIPHLSVAAVAAAATLATWAARAEKEGSPQEKPPSAGAPTAEAPADKAPTEAPRAEAPARREKGSATQSIAEADKQLLAELLKVAGAEGAKLSKVERTIERQTRVMYDLARSDVEHAKAMYCDAGDAVIDAFDAQASEAQNLARMQGVLEAQLPKARELGCLNHVENTEVYSVDVAFDAIPEANRDAFEAASRGAVKEGRAERFIGPPRHPGAFHFEFRRADKKAEE